MTKYALLDYDGFVCKAYYAAIAREGSFDEAYDILNDLTQCAQEKASRFFGNEKNIEVIKVMSGHSWKKDIYPTYKLGRRKDEGVGIFRDMVKMYMKDILIIPQLEADEVLIMYNYQFKDESIIFSDDKDLKYYSKNYCKINVSEEPIINLDTKQKYIQLLSGDSEDGITGIPKVGEKTAQKLLDELDYTLVDVISIYKNKGIGLDDCIKQLVLTIPMYPEWVDEYKFDLSDKGTMNNMMGLCRLISELVSEVYELG